MNEQTLGDLENFIVAVKGFCNYVGDEMPRFKNVAAYVDETGDELLHSLENQQALLVK